jgi:membrane protease YdiL (CAAX protease family)
VSFPAREEAPLKELAPLGNGWFFSLFLLTGLITVVACAAVYPLADRFVDDPGDAIRKMRVAGWARLLAFLLLFPFFSWLMFLTRADQASSCSSVRAFGISLAITPLILITAYLLMEAFQSLGRSLGREHPLVQLFRSGQSSDVWLVLGLVLVVAPFIEEIMFRVLFQQWITSALKGPILGWFMSFGLVVFQINGSGMFNFPVLILWCQIVFFMLLGAVVIRGGYVWSAKTASIFSGALVFAAVHSFAWPSPAGLFPLALGLGWLRDTTGRIWPCMIVHALFNGFGAMLM